MSKVFLRYIADKREFISNTALDQWIGGGLTFDAEKTLRGQIIELFEIENMPFEAIEQFYQEESNATETNQSEPS